MRFLWFQFGAAINFNLSCLSYIVRSKTTAGNSCSEKIGGNMCRIGEKWESKVIKCQHQFGAILLNSFFYWVVCHLYLKNDSDYIETSYWLEILHENDSALLGGWCNNGLSDHRVEFLVMMHVYDSNLFPHTRCSKGFILIIVGLLHSYLSIYLLYYVDVTDFVCISWCDPFLECVVSVNLTGLTFKFSFFRSYW